MSWFKISYDNEDRDLEVGQELASTCDSHHGKLRVDFVNGGSTMAILRDTTNEYVWMINVSRDAGGDPILEVEKSSIHSPCRTTQYLHSFHGIRPYAGALRLNAKVAKKIPLQVGDVIDAKRETKYGLHHTVGFVGPDGVLVTVSDNTTHVWCSRDSECFRGVAYVE